MRSAIASDYNLGELTNTPLPSPDTIYEFKVQTSLYDATQGRAGGGNINAILRGGTQNVHGSLYEFFRNDVLNANDFFFNRNNQPDRGPGAPGSLTGIFLSASFFR
jgi:hypothetical protein